MTHIHSTRLSEVGCCVMRQIQHDNLNSRKKTCLAPGERLPARRVHRRDYGQHRDLGQQGYLDHHAQALPLGLGLAEAVEDHQIRRELGPERGQQSA